MLIEATPTEGYAVHVRFEDKRSKFTRAGEIANERLVEAVLNPDRYPEGTTFIATDQQGFDSTLLKPWKIVGRSRSSIPMDVRLSPLLAVARSPSSRIC